MARENVNRGETPVGHRLLLAGSLPLAEPWNGADKNLAALLVRRSRRDRFVVHSDPTESWADWPHVTAVGSRSAGGMPTGLQKLRAFEFMLRYGRSVDLIHIFASLHSPARLSGPAIRLWAGLIGKPIVHTVPSVGDAPITRRNLVGDATVVFSEHTRERLEREGIPNVSRVFPPVDADARQPKSPSAPEDLRRDLALGDQAVLYPAHYGETSGIETMIRAFSRARKAPALKDAVLVLACRSHPWQDPDAERRNVLRQAAAAGVSDHVRVVGMVKDMPALIRACAVTAYVPEKMDGKMDLPLVILESLALGRPVVTSDEPPINEAFFGGGHAVRPGDAEALAASVVRLLEDASLRHRLAAHGRRAVLERCSPRRFVEGHQEIYDRLLGRHPGPTSPEPAVPDDDLVRGNGRR